MARVPAAFRKAVVHLPRAPRALARRYATRRPGPTPELVTQPHPWTRALGLVTVVLLGTWLGLLVVGNVRVPVGPMNTTMTLRPSVTGGTKINVSPLGALQLDSHTAPVRLDVNVDQLDPERSQALVDHPERLSGLQDEVARDVGRRIAARRVDDAAVAAAQRADLRLPAAVVARELVDEEDRRAVAGLLPVQADPVVGRRGAHGAGSCQVKARSPVRACPRMSVCTSAVPSYV